LFFVWPFSGLPFDVLRQIVRFEFSALADKHVTDASARNLGDQRFGGDAELPSGLGLGQEQGDHFALQDSSDGDDRDNRASLAARAGRTIVESLRATGRHRG